MSAKHLKINIFIFLFVYSVTAWSEVSFKRCNNSEGKIVYTNMPGTIDKHCNQTKNQYANLLEQDYRNLKNEFKKYETVQEEELVLDIVIEPMLDLMDSNKALDDLVDNSEEHADSAVKKSFKARSDAVEKILSEENPNDT